LRISMCEMCSRSRGGTFARALFFSASFSSPRRTDDFIPQKRSRRSGGVPQSTDESDGRCKSSRVQSRCFRFTTVGTKRGYSAFRILQIPRTMEARCSF
jgi:hypothetical protein